MAPGSLRVAPGPTGLPLLGSLPAFRRDVLSLALDASRTFGDVVRFRLGPRVVHLVNHPDHVHHVLQRNQQNYVRSARSAAKIALVCGESLLTTSGATWSRQRRMVQPAFHPQCLAAFGPLMSGVAAAMLNRWACLEDGHLLHVDAEMNRLAYDIAAQALFGVGIHEDADLVARAMDVLLEETYLRIGRVVDLPIWVPTAANRRFRRARASIDRVVYRIIANRRQASGGASDVLALLLAASDDEAPAAGGMNDKQLRDQTITLLLSGHETTATALAWTFYLLATHAEVEERLHSELSTILGGRLPQVADLPRLEYTTKVINETMRLYPPIWILERQVVNEDEIGGYRIPAGSTVVVSPFTLHRHPAFWQDPDRFVPERFTDGGDAQRAAGAFLPFGAGAHHCIGSHFAMLATRIVLATIAQSFRLHLVPGRRTDPKGGITLRFRDSLLMTAHRRQ